ncbi:cytochrome c oxidase subunit I [Anaeromyxobacter dehalogenans 2CP-1]|uniref:Cytochrome c oxidase subunit I n=1 Tax=Anaeromyxobacter dehalogenans (strain ATCC BAA-258 / DSM 21875 / 2CP-1) TaxID=455488 RepID=B8JGK5_ANAD2|nr:cbb3-type cytochrome c oxidase subunit I [Anaeromyxobacter dehalogenans]ACL64676.1 cytochrome c oxidase subunit I [Anaeromyxobacter dehalogenans 2CP-1]
MNDYRYDYQTVQGFILSAMFWGVVGILLGLLISVQLWAPAANFAPYLTYGRLRPVHTNGLIFGLGAGAIFGLFYYITMRLCKRPLLFPRLARVQLWLFNVGIVAAAVTLLLGQTQSLEYAELEWPLDLAIVVLWVMLAVNVFGTILKRREEQMYVSLWYIVATVITIAILYVVNNLAVPVSLGKSYPLFAGVNSANVQWWYGHNAVGFLLTTPILAMFYYFLPKSTGLPIYSHRLSIVAFWSLIFAYLWTGAHHLVYTPLPDWIQTLAIVFTMFLIAPSWGSVVNGYYTVGQDWTKVRSNYLTKFFILGITFYGLQTVQGPTQGLRVVSQLIHYTDWVPGHVHMGTMGWVTMIICASIYYVVPRINGTELYSEKLANVHFWLVLVGQLLFSITMWITGIRQGWMWKATDEAGKLQYTFMDGVIGNYPYWHTRTLAGIIFAAGMVVFVYNVLMTIRKGKVAQAQAGATPTTVAA